MTCPITFYSVKIILFVFFCVFPFAVFCKLKGQSTYNFFSLSFLIIEKKTKQNN